MITVRKYKLISEDGKSTRGTPVGFNLQKLNKLQGEFEGETLVEIKDSISRSLYKWNGSQWQALS